MGLPGSLLGGNLWPATRAKVRFVTRLKDNASNAVAEQRPVPSGGNILRGEAILLTSQQQIGAVSPLLASGCGVRSGRRRWCL